MTDISEKKPIVQMRVNLERMAFELELLFGEDLKPAPVGIYSAMQVEPVMVKGQQYYTRDPKNPRGAQLELHDINTAQTAVYDCDGKCVISLQVIQNKDRLLSDTPLLPYRGIKIACLLHEWAIDRSIRWRSRRSTNWPGKLFSEHLLPIDGGPWTDEVIEHYVGPFFQEIDQTLGELMINHEWHIFHLKAKDLNLTIERGEDYRVLEWMKLFEEGVVKL